jgi:hypothetical protein
MLGFIMWRIPYTLESSIVVAGLNRPAGWGYFSQR